MRSISSSYTEGSRPTSIAAVPELEDRWLIVNGVAKTYAMTGWRVGWLVGPADVIKGASNHQSHMTSNVNNIAQRAALAGITGPTEPIEEMRQAFDKRRQAMHGMLAKMAGCDLHRTRGGVLLLPGF